MPNCNLAALNGKDLQWMIVALDGPLSEGHRRDALLHPFGDNRIHQHRRVIDPAAKPGRQIDDVSIRGVVNPTFIANGSDSRWPYRYAHAKTHRVAPSAPISKEIERRLVNAYCSRTKMH